MAIEPTSSSAIDAGEEQWTRDWGQLLRLARQVAGLSLTELSARTGLSKGYLSKLESGHAGARNPSRATLAALARELPSFRPYAHALEPAAPLGALALGDAAPPPPLARDAMGERAPIQLGWRELEVLVAFLALDQSAAPVPLTSLTLARATGRATEEIAPVLARLVLMGVLRATPPIRVGSAPTYRRAPAFDDVIGLARLGDALVLAAALLVQAPRQSRHSDTSSRTS
ncbi:MAG TPA: helix-turn-helix transcriptional regulator [Ktedonobacterales bacterium]